MKLSEDDKSDLEYLCRLLIDQGILWEPYALGPGEVSSVYVYMSDEQGTYIAPMPVVEDIGYIFERIRDLLSEKPDPSKFEQ